MTKKYYGNKGFYELLDKMRDIHSSKNHDYCPDNNNPLQNFRMSEQMGIPAWKGVLVRISDKFSRVCSFARKEKYKVKDENVEDTLIDLAIYSLICITLYRERNK